MTLARGAHVGPYEILAPIGAGGMGEVYRARDKKLDRDVAIKVLPESLAADPDRLARFEREAKAVAALSHPNILAIHDFGTHEGISYAVMELLEGETLREKLDEGPLPQKQAVDYALQVARGLSAAHEKGVVHRDLKPENLFVAKGGHVKILDFGLAKRVEVIAPGEETRAPTASQHTEPGTVMGTVGYMSPEQVCGLPVDHRTDIFSFGAILYELLSGKRAFKRATGAETVSAILKEEPPELSATGKDISPALDHIVRHCLEKDRDNRFQTAKDIAFNLSEQSSSAFTSEAQPTTPHTGKRRVFIAAAALVVLAAAGLFILRRPDKGIVQTGAVKRVAVLPFENLGAPEDDYFADGIADEIRGKLTSLKGVQVIARSSSTPYKKTSKTPNQIAQELDVKYLLTATVRWEKSGGASRVHVTSELVEVSGSSAPASKWQQPFDAALTDVFQVQSDIASRTAQALGLALGVSEEKQLSEKPTQNLAAYDAYLKGEEARNRPFTLNYKTHGREALGFYEQAVALDPGFALAWARLSSVGSFMYGMDPTSPEPTERARQAAEKAMALGPDRPETYLALGQYQSAVVGDPERALEQFAHGLRLSPANAELFRETGRTEIGLGRWEPAIEHLRKSIRLDPVNLGVGGYQNLAFSLNCLRRYPEALEILNRGLAIEPTHLTLIEFKAMTSLMKGDLAGARAVLQAAPKEVNPASLVAMVAANWDLDWVLDEPQRELLLRLTPSAFGDDRADWGFCLARASALKGDEAGVRTYAEESRKAREEQLRKMPKVGQSTSYSRALLGVALAYLGRKEEAMREGERSVALNPATSVRARYYFQHQLARICILVNEPEKALDQLEQLLKVPYLLTPGWLKIDPTFDPLRKSPRFQRLVAGRN